MNRGTCWTPFTCTAQGLGSSAQLHQVDAMAVHVHEAGLCEQGGLLTPLPLQRVAILGASIATCGCCCSASLPGSSVWQQLAALHDTKLQLKFTKDFDMFTVCIGPSAAQSSLQALSIVYLPVASILTLCLPPTASSNVVSLCYALAQTLLARFVHCLLRLMCISKAREAYSV